MFLEPWYDIVRVWFSTVISGFGRVQCTVRVQCDWTCILWHTRCSFVCAKPGNPSKTVHCETEKKNCLKIRELEAATNDVYNWVRDFLRGKQQIILFDGTTFLPINRGVSQVTILGPVLFSVMVNDISSANISISLC